MSGAEDGDGRSVRRHGRRVGGAVDPDREPGHHDAPSPVSAVAIRAAKARPGSVGRRVPDDRDGERGVERRRAPRTNRTGGGSSIRRSRVG